jgi:hypothetical protein
MMTWKVQFIIDSSGVWRDSKYRFAQQTDALQFAWAIAQNFAARRWRIVETYDVQYQ